MFRVMVSPSPAGAEESDADRETHINDTSRRSSFQFWTLRQTNVSPRCVICSGICTGICSAATELGAGLPPPQPLSSSRVSRIWRAEEEGLPGPDGVCEDDMSSWRPFRRTGDRHTPNLKEQFVKYNQNLKVRPKNAGGSKNIHS